MRKPTRVTVEHLEDQVQKRKAQEDNPGGENSVPALRTRIDNLEHILAVKSYPTV